MRTGWLRACGGTVAVLMSVISAMGEHGRSDAAGESMLYKCERPGTGYLDIVSLRSGEKRIGKSLEWGTTVLVYDPSGRRWEAGALDVEAIEIRRDAAVTTRPALPDLTVAYVERLAEADRPTGLKIHVQNAGGAAATPFEYRVEANGRTIKTGQVDRSLAAGSECIIEALLEQSESLGELRIQLDVQQVNKEIVWWNNTFVEPIDAQAVRVIIAKDRADELASVRNLVDSFATADWLQYHIRTLNELFRCSTYASVPGGATRRLRIQGISEEVSVGELVETTAGKTRNEDVTLRVSPLTAGQSVVDMANRVDWGLCRDIGRQLGLLDLANFESPVQECMVRDSAGDFVQRAFELPAGLMMRGPGAGVFSELEVLSLNRGLLVGEGGSYLRQLPRQCGLILLDSSGRPMSGVDVTVFQRGLSDSGRQTIADQEIVVGESDRGGRLPLPVRPSAAQNASGTPWGTLAADGSNGLFLVRLRKNQCDEYRFVSVLEFALAAARGQTESYDLPLSTLFAGPGGPDAARFVRAKYFYEEPCSHNCMIQWPAGKQSEALEYRVFAMEDRSARGWTLVDVVPLDRIGHGGVASETVGIEPIRDKLSGGTMFTVVGVDKRGEQGWFAPPRYAPSWIRESESLAVEPESRPGVVLFSRSGPLDHGLVKSNFNQFHDDYGIRTSRFPGYEPWGGGMAFDDRKRLVMTDPHNHQVAWYERGELVQLAGNRTRNPAAASKKEGEFDIPSDVAVDDRGRVYIADTANNRVQQIDSRGRFVRLFSSSESQAEALFVQPQYLGYSSGRLCVTDSDGQRVQVFDVSGEAPRLVRTFSRLWKANRALVGASGRVYVLGHGVSGQDAVLIYPIEPNVVNGAEQYERALDRLISGNVRGPRGFYPDGTGNAYYVTSFPFIVQRVSLE